MPVLRIRMNSICVIASAVDEMHRYVACLAVASAAQGVFPSFAFVHQYNFCSVSEPPSVSTRGDHVFASWIDVCIEGLQSASKSRGCTEYSRIDDMVPP